MAEGTHASAIHPLTERTADAAEVIPGRILIVDGDDLVRESVARTLSRGGHEVVATCEVGTALTHLRAEPFDLLLADLKMPRGAGIELLGQTQQLRPEMPTVVMTEYASVRTAIEAVRRGAYDHIQKPFDKDDLLLLVRRSLEFARLRHENLVLRQAARSDEPPRPLIGSSHAMVTLRETAARVATTDAPSLVRGESGTGKEVVARMIHAASPRRDRPLLVVNCAASSEHLLESELFGHERGAFPGADMIRRGRFELAHGGTLLVDEVSAMPLGLQAKLVRMLQEHAFERVGSNMTRRVDVRIIATTNRSLDAAVGRGAFLEDLFHRLDVVALEVPPLRERREDIPELVRHFLHRIAKRDGQPFRHVEPDAMRMLQRYPWPGNVRELQNIIERAALLETQPGIVRTVTIAPWLVEARGGLRDMAGSDPLDQLPLADVEKRVILDTLAKFEGHRARTATALGIGVRTLGIKLKKWREDGVLAEVPHV